VLEVPDDYFALDPEVRIAGGISGVLLDDFQLVIFSHRQCLSGAVNVYFFWDSKWFVQFGILMALNMV